MSRPIPHGLPRPLPRQSRDRREVEREVEERGKHVRGEVERTYKVEGSLAAYLAADPKTRERFDRRQAREILADCDAEWRALNEIADDPVHRRVEFERWLRRADG